MTVKDLIKHLKKFDPNLECVCRRYSGLMFFEQDEIKVIKAATRTRMGWRGAETDLINMQGYVHSDGTYKPAMDDPDLKSRAKDYLFFEGN